MVSLIEIFVNMFIDYRSKDGDLTECDDYESSDQNSEEFISSTPVRESHHPKEQWHENDELDQEEQYEDEQEQEQEPYLDQQEREQRHVSFEWCQPYRESG